ncbi:Ig-like domain-containing protein [Chromobacterium violaceum]|uniref:Ig-like domain-containing protein n=1 Tax=Chromobacterium violaceum TaxID=536 RepID=UPI001B31B143|nr:Ig-like domain-containing protein [Chromobacterium violaceum]MBP4047410.1 Ig-like domain-containing protein [Chromobacterium violaceum]
MKRRKYLLSTLALALAISGNHTLSYANDIPTMRTGNLECGSNQMTYSANEIDLKKLFFKENSVQYNTLTLSIELEKNPAIKSQRKLLGDGYYYHEISIPYETPEVDIQTNEANFNFSTTVKITARYPLSGGFYKTVRKVLPLQCASTTITNNSHSFAPTLKLKVLRDNQLANGMASNEIQMTVVDHKGKGMPNQLVVFTAHKNLIISNETVTTNQYGIAKTTVASAIAGVGKIMATVNGETKTTTMGFTATQWNQPLTVDNKKFYQPSPSQLVGQVEAKQICDSHGMRLPSHSELEGLYRAYPDNQIGKYHKWLTNHNYWSSTLMSNGSRRQVNLLNGIDTNNLINSHTTRQPAFVVCTR